MNKVRFHTDLIMLIDDVAIDNFINERIITLAGFAKKIIAYQSAINALEYLKNVNSAELLPKYIFLDIHMPLIDGFQFLDSPVWQSPLLKDIKVIILTASVNPEDKEKSTKYPQVHAHLSKPLTSEMLEELKSNGNS